MTDIDYDAPGVPVLRAVFTDLKGRVIWIEKPYRFSNMSTVGEYMVERGTAYIVRRVAVCEGTMYANIEIDTQVRS